MNQPDPIDFRSHFSRSAFDAFVAAEAAYRLVAGDKTPESQPAVDAWFKSMEAFDHAALRKLAAMARAGLLTPVPFAQDRFIPWCDRWNELAARPPDIGADLEPFERLTQSMGFLALSRYGEGGGGAKAADPYEELLARVDAGSLPVRDASGVCDATGVRLDVEMDGWAPFLVQRHYEGWKRVGSTRIDRPVPAPAPVMAEIPLPSGKLLIADWFRIDAFTEAVDPKATRHAGLSINHLAGRLAKTAAYARDHGFLSICVGNSSPSVLFDGKALAIANVDEEAEMGPLARARAGRVCTDLWWATVIDRQTLAGIVAKTEEAAMAELLVDDYIRANDVTEVQLAPGGTLKAHYWDYGMAGHTCPQVDQRGLRTLYCAMAKQPLRWEPPKPAEAPGPAEPAEPRKPARSRPGR